MNIQTILDYIKNGMPSSAIKYIEDSLKYYKNDKIDLDYLKYDLQKFNGTYLSYFFDVTEYKIVFNDLWRKLQKQIENYEAMANASHKIKNQELKTEVRIEIDKEGKIKLYFVTYSARQNA